MCCVFTALFIYQNLHNPLSKLVIGLSRLFSGAPSGNRSRAPRGSKNHKYGQCTKPHKKTAIGYVSRVLRVGPRGLAAVSRSSRSRAPCARRETALGSRLAGIKRMYGFTVAEIETVYE